MPVRKPKSKTKSLLPVPRDAPGLPPRFLTRKQVLALIGVSYSTLWGWIRNGEFPPARELNASDTGRSKIAWLEHEVHHWMATRPQRLPKAWVTA